MTTVICLDDYHSLDRKGRSAAGVTALDPKAQHFDLMHDQVKALKEGKAVDKPIYNHVTGVLDPAEKIDPAKVRGGRDARLFVVGRSRGVLRTEVAAPVRVRLVNNTLPRKQQPASSTSSPLPQPTTPPPPQQPTKQILVIEGLHPFYDERVRDLLDFKIYLDISDEIKFAWKIQRDMAERGHSLDSIKKSIESRKPDFDAYIDPQKKHADMIIQVLPTQLVPDDEGKILRVRLIQKEGKKLFDPVYLFDEGSTISWIPCGRKLTCSFPGIKFYYGPDTWYGEDVSVLEMDGQFDKLEELIYVESHLSNTSAKFYGEITQQMLKNSSFPGSNNGTGLLQTIIGLKVREVYERITQQQVVPASA
jgi:uridine kinase